MSSRLLLLLALWLCPAAALAAPSVEELINKSVEAMDTTCYEARMLFFSQFDKGKEQRVYIYHCAPSLYRVEQLDSENMPGGVVYFEDAERLVRYVPRKGTEELPDRRFFLNDQLTIKFLVDLARHPGTIVLDGMVGNYPVHILRQDAIREKPYTVTVGLDKRNNFPLLLLVNNAEGERAVYFEMEVIEYRKQGEIPRERFSIDAQGMEQRSAPSVQKLSAELRLEDNENDPRLIVKRPGSAREESCSLPLYPAWLPEGYRVESVGLLDYFPGTQGSAAKTAQSAAEPGDSKIVFRLEARGGSYDRMISIIQTKADQQPYDFGGERNVAGEGFLVEQRGDWLIAVISGPDIKRSELEKIADSLEARDTRVAELIRQTRILEQIMTQAKSAGN